jgi:DNA-binding MarR family transcriptional regulator
LFVEDRTHSTLVALRRILRATDQHAKSLSRATGLTTPQWIVLQIVSEAGETTPKVIAERARISQATVSALIDRLEARGLVERARGQTDRRQIWISLTPSGRATLLSAPDALQSLFADKFGRLEDWEQAMILAALERVAALLNAEKIDASPLLDSAAIER